LPGLTTRGPAVRVSRAPGDRRGDGGRHDRTRSATAITLLIGVSGPPGVSATDGRPDPGRWHATRQWL